MFLTELRYANPPEWASSKHKLHNDIIKGP